MSKTYDTTEKAATGSNGGEELDEAIVGYTQAQISSDSNDDELLAYIIDPVEKKALLRRLDSFIAPMVAILYLISFLDRSNVSNAATGGMLEDINAPSNGLSVCVSIFYATVRPAVHPVKEGGRSATSRHRRALMQRLTPPPLLPLARSTSRSSRFGRPSSSRSARASSCLPSPSSGAASSSATASSQTILPSSPCGSFWACSRAPSPRASSSSSPSST